MTRNRILAAASAALLGLAGLTGLATPAHAADRPAVASYTPTCLGRIGDTRTPAGSYPISCTAATIGTPLYPLARVQTFGAEVSITNRSTGTVLLSGTAGNGFQAPPAPGDVSERLSIPSGGVRIPPGHSVTEPLRIVAYGPSSGSVMPAGDGAPVATELIGWQADVYGPWGPLPDHLIGSGQYPIAGGYPPGYTGPRYGVAANATRPGADQPAVLTAKNTSGLGEHLTICAMPPPPTGGSTPTPGRAIAGGVRGPGGSISQTVTDPHVGLAATVSYEAFASPTWGCNGAGVPLTVRWPAQRIIGPPPGGRAEQLFTSRVEAPPGQPIVVEAVDTAVDAIAGNYMTMCADGRQVAVGAPLPGDSLVAVLRHPAGSETVTVTNGGCSSQAQASMTVAWGSTPSTPRVIDVLPASVAPIPVGDQDQIYIPVSRPTWVSMCVDGRLVASGFHRPGTGLAHSITAPGNRSGTETITATTARDSATCTVSGAQQGASVAITWQ